MSGITNSTGAESGVVGVIEKQNTSIVAAAKSFIIYDVDHWSVANGGCCLAWTVPAGVQLITFEILSGGGPGGAAAHDCDIGHGGVGGNYAKKTLCAGDMGGGTDHFTAGATVYTLCAAGTSLCSCCLSCTRNCRHGCPSFVNGTSLSNFCAQGGQGGGTSWDVVSSCYNCHIGSVQCDRGVNVNGRWTMAYCNNTAYGSDGTMECFRGVASGQYKGYDCCSMLQTSSGSPTGPFSAPWSGGGKQSCYGHEACCSVNAVFPGGGGPGNHNSSTTPCVGGYGAGGLVKVTYQ